MFCDPVLTATLGQEPQTELALAQVETVYWRLYVEGRQLAVAFQDIDPDALRQRLEAYYPTYYTDLREMMARYSAISEDILYWLKGSKSVLATLCSDGVVATH